MPNHKKPIPIIYAALDKGVITHLEIVTNSPDGSSEISDYVRKEDGRYNHTRSTIDKNGKPLRNSDEPITLQMNAESAGTLDDGSTNYQYHASISKTHPEFGELPSTLTAIINTSQYDLSKATYDVVGKGMGGKDYGSRADHNHKPVIEAQFFAILKDNETIYELNNIMGQSSQINYIPPYIKPSQDNVLIKK